MQVESLHEKTLDMHPGGKPVSGILRQPGAADRDPHTAQLCYLDPAADPAGHIPVDSHPAHSHARCFDNDHSGFFHCKHSRFDHLRKRGHSLPG